MQSSNIIYRDTIEDHVTRLLSILTASMTSVENEYNFQCNRDILNATEQRPYADAYIELANAQKRLRRKYNITPLPGSPKWVLEILSACRRQKKTH